MQLRSSTPSVHLKSSTRASKSGGQRALLGRRALHLSCAHALLLPHLSHAHAVLLNGLPPLTSATPMLYFWMAS